MKRLAILGVVAGCMSPDLSTLKPSVTVEVRDTYLFANADFSDQGAPDVDVEATFRGKTVSLPHRQEAGLYSVSLTLDRPVDADEPFEVSIDGIRMTVMAPPVLDVDVPLFVSRSHDTTFTWATSSPDSGLWSTYGANCVQEAAAQIPAGATSATVAAATWLPTEYGGTCTVDIDFQRTHDGVVDPAFAGGFLGFGRHEVTSFASTP